jgi:hypothetical protein
MVAEANATHSHLHGEVLDPVPPTDLLAPHVGMGLAGLLLSAFLLGILHGVTPDEHTWPITLSYAIGAGTGRRGMQAGLPVLAPAMPNAAVAFLPGLLFGLGTMVVQAAAGAAIGAWMRSRGLGAAALTYVGRAVAGNTLLFGGLLFSAWGLFSLLLPAVAAQLNSGLPTRIGIPNLDSINAGLVLAAVIVLGIAVGSFVRAFRRVRAGLPGVTGEAGR